MSDLILNLYQLIPFLFLTIVLIVMLNVFIRMAGKSTKKTVRVFKK